jgi:hypothetical protein
MLCLILRIEKYKEIYPKFKDFIVVEGEAKMKAKIKTHSVICKNECRFKM